MPISMPVSMRDHMKRAIEPTQLLNGRTQLLFATGIERGIQDLQVLKYQPSEPHISSFHSINNH